MCSMIVFNVILLILSWFLSPREELNTTVWKVSSGSIVEVLGATNVNKFGCTSQHVGAKDQLVSRHDPAMNQTEWNGEFLIQSKKFDCNNSFITSDFQETVRADKFPEIKVKFSHLKKTGASSNQLDGKVEISLAGVTKRYPVSCFLNADQSGLMKLKGQQTILLSHFGLEPTPKLLGAVKVKDAITVNFVLVLKEVAG